MKRVDTTPENLDVASGAESQSRALLSGCHYRPSFRCICYSHTDRRLVAIFWCTVALTRGYSYAPPDWLRRVKAFVVRAEDARLLGDMPLMRKLYAELQTLNRKMIGEYAKRANNHQVGMDTRLHHILHTSRFI